MKSLLLKDLYTQKLFAYFFPFLLLFPFYVNSINAVGNFSFVAVYVSFVAIWMSVYSNFGTAALNRREQKLMSSLPVTRKMIVQAKYSGVIMWWVIGLVSYGTLAFFTSVLMGNAFSFNGITDLVISLFATLAIVSFFYPLYFLIGYQISAFIAISIPMAVFLGITILSMGNENRENILVSIIPADRPLIYFSIILACIIISFCSYKLSVLIFEKKDL
ncbi:ABC-2 transporter permease [Bacillus sp. FJAT-49711]|uniref:ABC-2 transporter permease n=1 Tax=Bacillus sp. FJAT-49711 TaxID=2833585 RepID=UPI001BCA529A|nr:ABC-2 transporter permease [Bacillus sp. FJAT-49711]MBS4220338.1 ABC-2 transporter permease [Bacillus sp. FJAT-49711]